MRYLFELLCVCALGVMPLVGCSETTGEGGSGGSAGTGGMAGSGGTGGVTECHNMWDCPCLAPLSDYCAGPDCPTLDEAVADAKEFAQNYCDSEQWPQGFFSAGTGRCGEFVYVYSSSLIGPWTHQYFDASGALVAVSVWSDTDEFNCGHYDAFGTLYGPVPDCELEPVEVFCPILFGD